jgi:hypothetical protein
LKERGAGVGSVAMNLPRASRFLVFVLMVLVGAEAMAREVAVATTRRPTRPPVYATSVQAYNGCHIATLAYLKRFRADFPDEVAEALHITMRNPDGLRTGHTMALVSWRGAWWCRDDRLGVFRLDAPIGDSPESRRLKAAAERALDERMSGGTRVRAEAVVPAVVTSDTAANRHEEVRKAARLLPLPSATFWVREGHSEKPFLFFRLAANVIAVYDPMHGTAVAETAEEEAAAVVRLVASRLGYKVSSVRTE